MSANAQTPSTTSPHLRSDPKRLGRLILGIVSLLLSIGYFVMALRMPQGELSSPGPGMFPMGVGVAAIVVSVIVVFESLLGRSESGSISWPRGHELKQCGIFLGTLVGFVLLLPLLGQYISATLYVALFLKFAGRLSWIRAIIFGLVIGAGLTFIFSELLDIALPRGIW